MSSFDDLMQEAREAGVDDAWLSRLQAASDASPLRQEKKRLEDQLAQVTERANTYRTSSLKAVFKEIGARGNPEFLKFPEDIDPIDTDKVREWAVNAGLADPPPPAVTPDEQATHQAFAEAAAGGGTPPPHDARAEALQAQTDEEFWRKAEEGGLLQQ